MERPLQINTQLAQPIQVLKKPKLYHPD